MYRWYHKKIFARIYPFYNYVMKDEEVFRTRDRHNDETVTHKETFAEYEQIQWCIVKLLTKFESGGIKIARVN